MNNENNQGGGAPFFNLTHISCTDGVQHYCSYGLWFGILRVFDCKVEKTGLVRDS